MTKDSTSANAGLGVETDKAAMTSSSHSDPDSIDSADSKRTYGTAEAKLKAQPAVRTSTDETIEDGTSSGDKDDNPFDDPNVAERYRQVYERAQYECRHVFDPKLTWTAEEEKKLLRRIDHRVCLWACVMFFALQMDRGNISQAVSDNMLQDLGMNTNDFNVGNTIFQVTFIGAELPSQLVSKKIGPDRWIPTLITTWSIVAMCQAAIVSRAGFYATRAILGLLVGGFVPDIVLWLSYFYTGRELPVRLSFFWTTISATGIITTFTGLGILQMRGVAGWPGWRWLFLIQGIVTFIIGVSSFFMMPPSIVQTKNWFRPNGWFNEREEAIAVNRVLRDDPSKGDMHNRQAITPRRLWNAAKDFDLWPLYLLGFIADIPQSPPSTYLTLILRGLGFNTYVTNLLTLPSFVMHMITLIGITWLSERFRERTGFAMVQSLWTLPCLIALRVWSGVVKNVWGTYALVTVLLSYPSSHAIIVGWLSKNSNNVGTRTLSVTIENVMVQLGGLYGNNIYLDQDKPLYHKGNTDLIIINSVCLALFVFTKIYYIMRNAYRDRLWARMTTEERYEYTHYSDDVGTKRLDFRFAH